MDDDFVTKTAKHRKKHGANGQQQSTAPAESDLAASGNSNSSSTKTTAATSSNPDGKPPAPAASGSAEGISLRPRTMFAMKGRGRTESEGSAYRPQWSKDGEGFVTAAAAAGASSAATPATATTATTGGASGGTNAASSAATGGNKDSTVAYHDPQGAADAARRKGKVLRYSKDELLALHFTTTSSPAFPPETMVASELALPPVSTLPFDTIEIYKQWEQNRNRTGRGRGRGTSTGSGQSAGDGGLQQQLGLASSSDRSRSNGKWEDDKWDKPARRGETDSLGDDSTWQRGIKPTTSSRHRDDIWDNVGDGSGDGNDMDLSSMALAAEKFRREMDALRNELNAPMDLKEAGGNLDEFDKKLEVAAAAGQFDDSDEENVQWDEPTDASDLHGGLSGSSGGGGGGGSGSLFFEQAAAAPGESPFGLLDTTQFGHSNSTNNDLAGGFALLQQQVQQQQQQQQVQQAPPPVVDEWFYLDPQGIQQGPFTSAEMREWFDAGYFKPHLPIRFGLDGPFAPLANQFGHGHVPFAVPPSSQAAAAAAERERQEQLYAREQQEHQEQQRQDQQRRAQEAQMLQLQQQQERQRLLQLNQEEKIRIEMARLDLARQQQSHMFQQQLLQQQQHQQQHMLLQQQSSWQRSQRDGIMSALGLFGSGGTDHDRVAAESYGGQQHQQHLQHQPAGASMQPQFQSDYRTQHQLGAHDPALRDALFLGDSGARQQQNEFWGGGQSAPVLTDAHFSQQQQQQQQLQQLQQPQQVEAQHHIQDQQQHQQVEAQQQQQSSSPPTTTDPPADPWGKPLQQPATAATTSAYSLHEIQDDEKRRAAQAARARTTSPTKPTAATVAATATASPGRPAAAATKSSASATPPAKTEAAKKATKSKSKTPESASSTASAAAPSKAAWNDPNAAPPATTKSLEAIQQEEQRELRKQMANVSRGANLEQMGAQLKMMLGVQAAAAPAASTSAPSSSSTNNTSAGTGTTGTPGATTSTSSGASPWGVPAAAAQPTPMATKQSLRDILAEEERLAHERAKQSHAASGGASSHWVNVVAGTAATPAPKPTRAALGPVPVSVLKSRRSVSSSADTPSVGAGAKPGVAPTPPKSDSTDASFWNFGAAKSSASASSASAPSSGSPQVSNAFGGTTGVSSEFTAWAAKQFQQISGRADLTLMEYCVSLEDPGEIREYLAAYLGSTPRVSAFATEFIQRKKKAPVLKRAASTNSSSSSSSRPSGNGDDDSHSGATAKKSGNTGKRRGGKGQKIDPSLLNFA